MAVTAFSQGYVLAAANDVIPGIAHIKKIHLINAAATTILTLRADGAAGTIIWSRTVTVVNDTVEIYMETKVNNFAVSALPAAATVVVFTD